MTLSHSMLLVPSFLEPSGSVTSGLDTTPNGIEENVAFCHIKAFCQYVIFNVCEPIIQNSIHFVTNTFGYDPKFQSGLLLEKQED